MKTLTPVRRSRSSRPNTAGDGVPVNASMELLPPEAASSPSVSASYNNGDLLGRQSQDFMAMGAPATLQQGSRPGTMRRTHSASRDAPQVVLLSSTRPLAESSSMQGQQIGMLLQQLSAHNPSASSSSPLAPGAQLSQSMARSSSNRYASNPSPTAGPTSGGANRPGSATSTASSMLVGGVPGPLPATTPGMMSRMWSPESCIGSELDDSANTRANTAHTRQANQLNHHHRERGMGAMSPEPGGVGGGRQVPRGPCDDMGSYGGGLEDQGSYPGEDAEYYRYLQSRRPTDEGAADGGHEFTIPDYDDHVSASRQSLRPYSGPLGASPSQRHHHHHHQDDDDCMSEVPGTPHSVASGVMRGSGVFFTALRRSLGGNDGLGEEESMLSARSVAPTEALSLISHANPMQEPSAAQSQDQAGGGGESSGGVGEEGEGEGEVDTELTDYLNAYDPDEDGSKSVWENPVQTPRETTAAPSAEPSRASFISLLRDLYSDTGAAVEEETQPAHQEQDQEEGEGGAQQVEQEEGGDVGEAQVDMGVMDEAAAAQEERRRELNEYMAGLQSKLDEEGHTLVELPKNYQVLVEQLLLARRAEYASLAGWLGPRKFSDLPIHNLPDTHDDPKVAEGLGRIRALDQRLAEKEAEGIILARERDPERWAQAERARLARQALAVEEALKRERMRRMRSAKLARALTPSGSEQGDDMRASTAFSTTSSRMGPSQRLLQLRPDEEALVEAVLRRDEREDALNPFEFSSSASLPPDNTNNPSLTLGPGGSRPTSAVPRTGPGSDGTTSGLQGAPLLAPLALSSPLAGLQSEASAAQLLRMAHQVATGLAAGGTGAAAGVSGGQGPGGGTPRPSGDGDAAGGVATGTGVDLAAGLAVHTRALLRAQQAAVAGMPLGVINAHLEQFAQEHLWAADGSLADFTSLSVVPGAGAADGLAAGHRERGPGRPHEAGAGAGGGGGEPPLIGVGAAARPAPPGSVAGSGSVVAGVQKRDYLREEREAKELVIKEAELDTRIRAFKTSDPAGTRLSSDQLAALVAECKALAQRAAARHPVPPETPAGAPSPPLPSPSAAAAPPIEVAATTAQGAGKQAGAVGSKGRPKAVVSPLPQAALGPGITPGGGRTAGAVTAAPGAAAVRPGPGSGGAGAAGPQGVAEAQRPSSGVGATGPQRGTRATTPSHDVGAQSGPSPAPSPEPSSGRLPSAGRRAGSGRAAGAGALACAAGPAVQATRPVSGGQAKAGRRSGGVDQPPDASQPPSVGVSISVEGLGL